MKGLLARIVGYLVIFLGVGIALSLVGAPIQPLLAAAIVVVAVLGLALHGIAENFAAGVLLQTRRPIHVGDEVQSLGFEGNVVEIMAGPSWCRHSMAVWSTSPTPRFLASRCSTTLNMERGDPRSRSG
jgi:Flp pilus assembly secretin CpaC